MAYNPNILQEALHARRLTSAQLSRRLGIDLSELKRELLREPEPRQDLLKALARELVLPPFAFYMERLPPKNSIWAFRAVLTTSTLTLHGGGCGERKLLGFDI